MSKRGEHEEKARRAIAAAQESGPLGVYLTRVFNGHTIHQRPSTGYIHATAMCKVKPSKKIAQWHMNKETQAFLEALSLRTGIPVKRLVQTSTARSDRGGGTWIHPEAAIHLAMWIDPSLAVQVIQWTSRFFSGDPSIGKEITDLADERNETLTITTQTTIPRHLVNTIDLAVHAHMATAHVRDLVAGAGGGAANSSWHTDMRTLHSTASLQGTDVHLDSVWLQRMEAVARELHSEPRHTPPAEVYFIRAGATDLVKVGCSANVAQRLSSLQTANGEELKLEYSFMSTRAREHELAFHRHLAHAHVRGEWFRLPSGYDFAALVKDVAAQ